MYKVVNDKCKYVENITTKINDSPTIVCTRYLFTKVSILGVVGLRKDCNYIPTFRLGVIVANFCYVVFTSTGWPKRIWTILWGCLEVTEWLRIKKLDSSKKIMQKPLKVNKAYFLTSTMASQWPFDFFFQKVKITPYLCMDSNTLDQEGPWTKEKLKLWSPNFQKSWP